MLGGGARLVVESGPSLLRTLVRESHGLLLGSSILKMNTLRLREFKQLAQGHTARKWQSWYSHPDHTPKPRVFLLLRAASHEVLS